MANISEEYTNELKDTFEKFDKDGDGSIQTKELINVFKYLNQNMGDDEINIIMNEVDPDGNGTLDFAQFILLMTKKMRDDDTQEELLESFKVFDPEGTGTISIHELRYILFNLGDKMTNEEVDEIVKDVDPEQTGFMKYEPYVKEKLEKLLAKK